MYCARNTNVLQGITLAIHSYYVLQHGCNTFRNAAQYGRITLRIAILSSLPRFCDILRPKSDFSLLFASFLATLVFKLLKFSEHCVRL